MSVTKQQFIDHARTWIGVRYHHQQASRAGADCIGIILGVAAELGYDWHHFDIPYRGRYPDGHTFQEQIEKACKSTDKPEPGDLLLFKIWHYPQHCALLTDKGTMIHSYTSIEKVTENDFSEPWKKLFVKAYELPL